MCLTQLGRFGPIYTNYTNIRLELDDLKLKINYFQTTDPTPYLSAHVSSEVSYGWVQMCNLHFQGSPEKNFPVEPSYLILIVQERRVTCSFPLPTKQFSSALNEPTATWFRMKSRRPSANHLPPIFLLNRSDIFSKWTSHRELALRPPPSLRTSPSSFVMSTDGSIKCKSKQEITCAQQCGFKALSTGPRETPSLKVRAKCQTKNREIALFLRMWVMTHVTNRMWWQHPQRWQLSELDAGAHSQKQVKERNDVL